MKTTAYERGRAAGHEQGFGVPNNTHWMQYMAKTREAAHDWNAEFVDFKRGFEDGVTAWKAEHPYAVLGFGSHPDSDNDDCYTGADYATLGEALAAYLATPEPEVAFVMLDGPDVNKIRSNPHYRARRVSDDEWRLEIATQAGMAFGCDGYNDAMGY